MPGPRLWPRARSWSPVLAQSRGPVWISVALIITVGCAGVCGLGTSWSHGDVQGLHCPGVHTCQPGWPAQPPGVMLTIWLGLLPRIMCVSVVLRWPGSVLMSLTHDATRDYAGAWGLGCSLILCLCLKAVPLLGPSGSGLGCELGPWYCPDHGCRWGPCLGLWSNLNQCLCWYLWFLRPSKTLLMLGVWVMTWGHVGVWGPCCCRGHAGPGSLRCLLGPRWHLGSCLSLVLPQPKSVLMFLSHAVTKGHVDAGDLGYNLQQRGHPRAMLPP